ncbi:MAG: 3'-5' exonuclease [Pseudonocardiaceae bacterium]
MTDSIPAALKGKRLVVVDIEGNGQQPPEIIEVAVMSVDGHGGSEPLQDWLIRPEQPITQIVTRKVHGISNQDVASCPPWSAVASDVEALLTDRILVAHNATVEHRVLGSHLPNWRPPLVLDTLRLAKHVWPGLTSYGLDQLTKEADLDTSAVNEQRYHRARYDAWCAWQLLRALTEHSRLDWAGLVKVAALPGFVLPDEPEEGLW